MWYSLDTLLKWQKYITKQVYYETQDIIHLQSIPIYKYGKKPTYIFNSHQQHVP